MLDRIHQAGQIGRIMGEVGVHLDNCLRPVGESSVEPGPVGGAEALLLLAMQHRDGGILLRQLVCDEAGPVRG